MAKKESKKLKEKEDLDIDEVNLLINYELEKQKKEAREKAAKLREESNYTTKYIITLDNKVKAVSELTKEEKLAEYYRCALDPVYFIETYLTIFDQTKDLIVPFKLFDFQKDLIEDYRNHRFNVANKYRQAGISTTTCAYITWYVMFNENAKVAIVANKLETARDELMSDIIDFIDQCPEFLVPHNENDGGKKLKDAGGHKKYVKGREIKAFAPNTLRGLTPTLIFWDEAAWAQNGFKFWESARPTLQTGGGAIFVSCVTKDTFIFTDKGIKEVSDFVNDEVGLGGYYVNDYKVLGIDKLRTGNLFFNNGYVDTLKISTKYSYLETSKNHKYWAYQASSQKYGWVKAEDLTVNDYISIQFGKEIWGNNDDLSNFKPTVSNSIKNVFKPEKITPDLAYFIGLYISEGYIRKLKNKTRGGQIVITCGDDVSEVFKNLNLKFSCKDGIHYVASSYNLIEFFQYIGFDISKKAPQKTIPTRLLEMSRENIIAMLQGIMDSDGYASYNQDKNKLRVGISLSSKRLVEQIRIILNNFGILTEYREQFMKPTKKVKACSMSYRIIANGSHAVKYFEEIGFKLKRKQIRLNEYKPDQLAHAGVTDNIPDGSLWAKKIYKKEYGKVKQWKKTENFHIENLIWEKTVAPKSRKNILKLIELEKNNITEVLTEEFNGIINENIVWVKIDSIEESKNYTYDFSLPSEPVEPNEFNHSVIYNGMVTHQTPNGLDPVFYETINKAPGNGFNSVELWWYNDPRYIINKETGEIDLEWVKNEGTNEEIRIKDENFDKEKRKWLVNEGYRATSSWFEKTKRGYNGNERQLAQELLCVGGETMITIEDTNAIVKTLSIEDFYKLLEQENISDPNNYLLNT